MPFRCRLPARPTHAGCRKSLMIAVAIALMVGGNAVRAEVWGYVDEAGEAHVAPQRLDDRYHLFFKGGDADATAATSAEEQPAAAAADPFVKTAAFQRLANDPNTARFRTLIERHAVQHDVDPALVKAIVAVESGFEPGAISPKGARGLMQVMPETAARYGVTTDRRRSAEQKLLDPAVNLQVGTRYLRDLLARFANDLGLALAAYNAGETAVERHNNQIPPYPETVAYVKRVRQFYAAFTPAAVPEARTPQTVSRGIRGTFLARPALPGSEAPIL